MWTKENLDKVVDTVGVWMERHHYTESDAIKWVVLRFLIPYRIFVPAYVERKGSIPEEYQHFLNKDS